MINRQEVIANILTRATISFPEHTPSRVCSRNGAGHANETCANLNYAVKRFVYILKCYIFKYDALSEYLTLFWFAVLLSEYEICLGRIQNFGNVYIQRSSHCYDGGGLDFHFRILLLTKY